MFVLVRAITYASVFTGLILIFLPGRLLSQSGIVRPELLRAPQIAGAIVAVGGSLIALWCVLSFALIGRGTPAPFDPPRRLVVKGPYALVRNPMYIGAGLALGGAALFYQSLVVLAYVAVLFVASHLFIVYYEEPALRRTFGGDYDSYCRHVRRWWPQKHRSGSSAAVQ